MTPSLETVQQARMAEESQRDQDVPYKRCASLVLRRLNVLARFFGWKRVVTVFYQSYRVELHPSWNKIKRQ
uniref:Uncharacterized protein n=1 Tax=Ciona savignyi TaxID=51511 RepID=H2Z091_CIOSA